MIGTMPVSSPRIDPKNVESPFGIEELFFSTTDRKGIIRSGNQVFVRVSKHELENLLGAPHNIIRHPDMPRAVFKLLWDYLLSGRTIAAYVKNLAADGSYYWVFALVVPLSDGGFLSIRLKPTCELFGIVKGLYVQLCEIEKESADRGEPSKQGMQLATEALVEALESLGISSYDAFMHHALQVEMKSRDEALQQRDDQAPKLEELPSSDHVSDSIFFSTLEKLKVSKRHGDALYQHVDELLLLHKGLDGKAAFLKTVSRELRITALNTSIIAAKLMEQGVGLGTVADQLGESSNGLGVLADSFFEQTQHTTEAMMKSIFHLATVRLGVEVSTLFCREAMNTTQNGAEKLIQEFERQTHEAILSDLGDVLNLLLDEIAPSLNSLTEYLRSLQRDAAQLAKSIFALRFVLQAGVVESVRINVDDSVGALLRQLEKKITKEQGEIRNLDSDIHKLLGDLDKTPALLEALRETLATDEQLHAVA